jgi:mannose-6-phosphate isomerase-like protein (cupin superfamily)
MREVAHTIDDPRICVVKIRQGETPAGALAELLNPVDPATFHEWRLPANSDVELHCHDFDEYWWFTSGTPEVTLRAPNGRTEVVTLEPGDMVACVRGIEHTLKADHELIYFQYSSVREGGEREGHLSKE